MSDCQLNVFFLVGIGVLLRYFGENIANFTVLFFYVE